jgi:hypothetical protein
VIINSFQNLVNRCVPRITDVGAPFSWHFFTYCILPSDQGDLISIAPPNNS